VYSGGHKLENLGVWSRGEGWGCAFNEVNKKFFHRENAGIFQRGISVESRGKALARNVGEGGQSHPEAEAKC